MATKQAPSTKKYGLYFGVAVSGMSSEAGVKFSHEVANMTRRDGEDKVQATEFLADVVKSNVTYSIRYGKGVQMGDNKIYAITLTGAEILDDCKRIASEVEWLTKHPAKQIAGSKEITRNGGGRAKKALDFTVHAKPQKQEPEAIAVA